MQHKATSISPFLGARDFDESRRFYTALGFDESPISPSLTYFAITPQLGFYLQNAYVKDWVDNTMVFVEVEDVDQHYQQLLALDLPARFPGARVTPTRVESWGKECFVHDPSGILWHFGAFF
jgi:catechol 2,3-dioxygenase-like lactoylglutathione lyase family enzyme